MADQNFDIFGGFKQGYDNLVDPQTLGNWYLDFDKDAPDRFAFLPIPGSKLKFNSADQESTAEVRLLFTYNDSGYGVIGDGFYEFSVVDQFGALTAERRGTFATTSGFVDWDANLTEILMVDGGSGYLWDGTTFTTSIANFPADPIAVTYLDGYFLVAQSSTNKFFRSAQENGTSWDSNNSADLTTDADKLTSIAQLKRRVFVFGSDIAEAWYAVGGSGFGFERDNNVAFEFGCIASGSMVLCKEFAGDNDTGQSESGFLIWLGTSPNGGPRVLMTDGGSLIPISNEAVELAIQDFTDPTDARGYVYKINGHVFYVLNFTTDDKTFVYDLTTRSWFTQYMSNNSRYFGQTHMYFNNTHYVGRYDEDKVYKVSRDYATNAGDLIKRERICKNIKIPSGKRFMVNTMEVEFRQGLKTPEPTEEDIYFDDAQLAYSDDGGEPYYDDNYDPNEVILAENPRAFLSISMDGGVTYGNEVKAPLGGTGSREVRTQWRRLGIYDTFIAKITVYEGLGMIVIGANWDVEEVRR